MKFKILILVVLYWVSHVAIFALPSMSSSSSRPFKLNGDSILQTATLDSSKIDASILSYTSITEKYASLPEFSYKDTEYSFSLIDKIKEIYYKIKRYFLNRDSDGFSMKDYFLILIFPILLFLLIRFFINQNIRKKNNSKNRFIETNIDNIEYRVDTLNFDNLIATQELEGNTRQCVRLLYLQLLKKMSDAGIIKWHIDKTNVDYLLEIKDPSIKERMRYIVYLYNYIWYGEFSIDDSEYLVAKDSFISISREIKSLK